MANVFSVAGSIDIMAYIKNPEHVSNMIEGIQNAEFNYIAASKYATNNRLHNKRASYMQSRDLILNGYLSELRAYRYYLESHNNVSYEDINQIAIDIKDLQTISNWLKEKYENNDFQVYNDEDFYNEVFMNLKSDVKSYYFE